MTRLEAEIGGLDRLFDVLSQAHRRHILSLVGETDRRDDEGLVLGDLVSDEDGRERRTLELVHVNLPKLEDAGYVTWDREGNAIRRGPRFDEVASVIELMQNHQESLPNAWP